jgi:microcystin-dependent protein
MSNVFNENVTFNSSANFFDTVNVFGKLEVIRDITVYGNSDVIGNSNVTGSSNVIGNITAASFIKSGGISNQFLKADGSVDSTTYLTGATVGGTPDNVGGQLVVRNGIGGFSAGIVTTTSLIVNGDARITGILTVGSSSVTINGSTNTISGVSSVTDNSGGYLSIPPGAIQFFARNTAPSGWIKANGATISRSTYADLFAALGTTFGAGDGSTTFTLPDMRGEFPRGWDDGRGIDSGRTFGGAQADEFKSHSHTLTLTVNGSAGNDEPDPPKYTAKPSANFGNRSPSTNSPGGTETRPRNIALLACIKY